MLRDIPETDKLKFEFIEYLLEDIKEIIRKRNNYGEYNKSKVKRNRLVITDLLKEFG